MIIAIDPGKNKCGLAVLTDQGKVIEQAIVQRSEIKQKLCELIQKHNPNVMVMGNSANGRAIKAELTVLNFTLVSEKNSSLEARKLYWQEHPAKAWQKIIPTTLRTPPRPIDDYAAIIIGQAFIQLRQQLKI